MKKTIVLLTIVLAIVAAPVFAEVTASGSVEFDWAWGADDTYKDKTDNTASITLDGTVGEFTTISAVVEDGDLNEMTLTQDVTGALGMDGAASLSYKVGVMTYSPKVYNEVAPYTYDIMGAKAGVGTAVDQSVSYVDADGLVDTYPKNFKSVDMLGLKATIGIADMLTVDAAFFPGSFFTDYAGDKDVTDNEFGINGYGTFGMANVSVFYVASAMNNLKKKADADDYGKMGSVDSTGNRMGISASADVMDGLKMGVGFEMALAGQKMYVLDMTSGTSAAVKKEYYSGAYSVDAAYTLDALTAGLSFKSSISDDPATDDISFAEASNVAVSVKYALTEAVSATAAYFQPLAVADGVELSDANGFEIGATAALDGVTYGVGYTLRSDYSAYNAKLVNDKAEKIGNVYFNVKASF